MTHNSDNNEALPAPELKMERVLFACDELSGLIQAAVIMRPSKSVMDFETKSLKKKYKDKRFAAGCDREVIRKGAELNGMTLPGRSSTWMTSSVRAPPYARTPRSREPSAPLAPLTR